MKTCPKCGFSVEDEAAFCQACGADLKNPDAAPAEETPIPIIQPRVRELNILQLIWSIINLICCCTPLGVAGLVLTITAKSAVDDITEQKNLRYAQICNIIATAVGAVVFLVTFIIGFMQGLSGAL